MTLSENDTLHVSTRCIIPALPTRVWAVLADFGAYPVWNPFVRSIAGELRSGARLTVQIAPPGKKPMGFRPRLLKVDHGRELRWLGHVWVPGLVDGEHQFYMEPDGHGGTVFVHRERFSGLLARLVFTEAALEGVKAGFEAMNDALSARVMAGLT